MHLLIVESFLPNFLAPFIGVNTHWHLFTNNVTTGLDAVLGDFTEETGAGYAILNRSSSDWTLTADAGHVYTRQAADLIWVPDPAVTFTNYGMFVTLDDDTTLIGFVKFDTPPVVTTNPAVLQVPAKISIKSIFAS